MACSDQILKDISLLSEAPARTAHSAGISSVNTSIFLPFPGKSGHRLDKLLVIDWIQSMLFQC